MPVRKALVIDAGGERFRFYYDIAAPQLLHITLRHGTAPHVAIRTFFEGDSAWDDARARFVTTTTEHCLYWARHNHDQSVVVISCFERGEQE